MAEIVGDRAVDPDAQAAVTDFLDYTEYLPSDLIRSLSLIRGLDETYYNQADALNDLTKLYGSVPNLEPSMRPNVQDLRLQILSTLDSALNAQESAYAEACRLFDVADRHHNRLRSISAKLKAIPKPPSRDPTPQPPTSTQKRSRTGREIKPGARLTLNPPRTGAVATAILGRPRGRRVTVPGEVLPPYDPDEAIASTEVSDWESPPPPSPPRPMLKLKQPKLPKEKEKEKDKSHPVEKPPRAPREHATYKKPTPPPEDAELGSQHRPWTHLTEFEMYKLRKKMKKNHTWDPSPIMIRRELEDRGRGLDNYNRARAEAELNGTSFNDITTTVNGSQPSSSISVAHAQADRDKESEVLTPTMIVTPEPRMKALKKADSKKDKKADDGGSSQAAVGTEGGLAAAALNLGNISSTFKNLFRASTSAFPSFNRSLSSPSVAAVTPVKRTEKTAARKRKLDQVAISASPSAEPDAQRKKQKTSATAKPSPLPSAEAPSEVPQLSAGTIKIPLKLVVPAPVASPTPESATPAMATQPINTGRASVPPKTEESPPPLPSVASRPVSRKSTVPPDGPDESGVETATPSIRAASRRASATPAAGSRRTPSLSLRQTPAIDSSPRGLPTAASRRPKREVPGTVTQSSQDGGVAVSVSKRKNKPGKQKKAASTTSPEVRVDIDGRTEIVDPNEERYCICGDVSYGEMICCELDEKVSHRCPQSDSQTNMCNSASSVNGFTFHAQVCRINQLGRSNGTVQAIGRNIIGVRTRMAWSVAG